MLSNPPPPDSNKPAVSARWAGTGAQTCSKLLAGAADGEIIKLPFLLILPIFGEGHSWHTQGFHGIMMFFVLMVLMIEQKNNTVTWSPGRAEQGRPWNPRPLFGLCNKFGSLKGRCFHGFSFHFWCCWALCRNLFLSAEMFAFVKVLVLWGTWEHF